MFSSSTKCCLQACQHSTAQHSTAQHGTARHSGKRELNRFDKMLKLPDPAVLLLALLHLMPVYRLIRAGVSCFLAANQARCLSAVDAHTQHVTAASSQANPDLPNSANVSTV